MKYNPKDADMTLPDGLYDAVLFKVTEEVSKNGNLMLHAGIQVWSNTGKSVFVHSYFVDNNAGMLASLKQLCDAVGVEFSTGEVSPEQLQGLNLKVMLTTEPGRGGYGPKNVVTEYLKDNAAVGERLPAANASVPDDDGVPF